MRIAGTVQDSIVDGPGLRFTVFTQGCPHHCEGCHNPQTHDPDGGTETDVQDVIAKMLSNPLTDGVTLSGGEPFAQAADCLKIAEAAHAHGLNVWAYSGYTFEQVKVHGMSRNMSPIFQDAVGSDLVGRFHLSLTRDTRNSAMNPTRGYSINALAAVTSKIFGASNNYARLELKGTYHYPFFRDWFVFSVGGKVGFLSSIGSGDPVPLYERYFLGGGDSVRGFPYRSIGPEDYNKDNYGGQTMYILTAELSHPIYSIVRGAAFIDIGDAGPDRFRFSTVNIGVGYGLRIKLPSIAAPLRLDFAFPVVNNQDGVSNSLRFHFNVGASFGPR